MITPLRLIDLHVHLDLFEDFEKLVDTCEQEHILTLTVTTTPRAWPRNRALTDGKRYVRAALGLHPELVAERADEISLFERYLPEARYVGEVGLDGRRKQRSSFAQQQTVLERVLKGCAREGNKILSVHSAGAATEVLDLLEQHLSGTTCRVVLHWFSGPLNELKRAVAHGCYFSVNPQMLSAPSGRHLVEAIPKNRLLTETDGPFVQIGGRPARPRDVHLVVNKLAVLKNTTPEHLSAELVDNLRALTTDGGDK